MRTFNIEHINPAHVFRVYKDGNDLVIWSVTNDTCTYPNLTKEEMDTLIRSLKEHFNSKRFGLEVYNGLDEAKNH